MAKIVVVTSGKGGVGKTTTSASFASGLAPARPQDRRDRLRRRSAQPADLIMGCERRVVYDLINVIHGEANRTRPSSRTSSATTCSCWPPARRATRTPSRKTAWAKVLSDAGRHGL